ncbi:MAG TPA: glucosamine-6-phosphate deaminase [Anaerovoracaceae bacterium]|nr:glucosamine-6-phosphate deaminase [Anaerovoracaceae bacterium]
MKMIRANDYQDMSRKAANILSAQLVLKEDSVLGLATGSTMIGLYRELVSRYCLGDLDFSKVKTVNLDEYLGLHPSNPQSYRYYMDRKLFNHVNILDENTYIPNGMTDDTDEECAAFDTLIDTLGGIDLQLLGMGHDGHIGFNEPDDIFFKNSHCVLLKESTIEANSRFFDHVEDVPRHAITIGIGAIMKAKTVLLCVNGEAKAPILREVLYGPITPKVPGSILQLHTNLIVVADKEALKEIEI